MPSLRLDHINIVVTDTDEAVRFFTEGLGFRVTKDVSLSGAWLDAAMNIPDVRGRCIFLEADEGGCRIELLQFLNPSSEVQRATPLTTTGLRHFAIEVTDMDAAFARVTTLGYRTIAPPVDVPRTIIPHGKKLAYILGPDGVIVELAAYGK